MVGMFTAKVSNSYKPLCLLQLCHIQAFSDGSTGLAKAASIAWPSTNNAIESMNARLREMLRRHRGMPLLHRVKAIFWWCCMHTENAPTAAEAVRMMPTDDDVDGLFEAAAKNGQRDDGAPEEYGTGIVWSEFHMPTEFKQ